MGKIAETFAKLVVTKSDVQEHLPTLARYASECTHITELGVRTALSTYALLYGKPKSAKLISYDIYSTKEVEELIKIAKEEKSNWEFIIGDTREIDVEETDMIFIDTLHNYDLLKIELERHAPKARKYIIFHDTTTFGESGETKGHDGLNKAIMEYQSEHREWLTKEIYTNNNGLTVLERKPTAVVTVFTAIYGDIDSLKLQPEQTIPTERVCFTDNPNLQCEQGSREQRNLVVTAPHKHLHPRMQAKYFRTHPHDYINSGLVMYMDGSARLTSNDSVEHLVGELLDKSDILTFKHPDRNSIKLEMEFCLPLLKYAGLPMKEQVEWYIKKGYPVDYGLTGTGLLIYKRDNENTKEFLHKRWCENLTWTYQDQLSFDPVVYFTKIKRQWLEENLLRNDYINFLNPHRHKG